MKPSNQLVLGIMVSAIASVVAHFAIKNMEKEKPL